MKNDMYESKVGPMNEEIPKKLGANVRWLGIKLTHKNLGWEKNSIPN